MLATEILRNWDCRSSCFDQYAALARQQQAESCTTAFAAVWVPLDNSSAQHGSAQYIATGLSNGEIRLYCLPDLLQHYQDKAPGFAEPVLRLLGHTGPVYTLSFARVGAESVLFSGGADACLKGWFLRTLLDHCTIANEGHSPRQLEPDVLLSAPRTTGPFAKVSEINSLVVDKERKLLAAGCGSGVMHVWDLARAASAALRPQAPMSSIAGHEMAILDVAVSQRDGLFATASQDGNVSEWDVRAAASPVSTISSKAARQSRARSTGSRTCVPCVAYDPSSNWLVMGTQDPSIMCWSRVARQVTMAIPTTCTPQALQVVRDKILIVGTEPYLSCYNFAGDCITWTPCSPRSAWCLDVDPNTGLLLAGGSHGTLDVITDYGSRVGTVRNIM